jgi:hypothetical protein
MTDARVITTEHLIALNEKAKALDLNCVASDEFIARLDPKCLHLGVIQVFGHNVDFHPTFHHRVFIWCKMRGSTDQDPPAELTLDITGDDWDGLLTVQEVMG